MRVASLGLSCLVGLGACGGDEAAAPMPAPGEDGGGAETGDTEGTPQVGVAANRCQDAPRVTEGRQLGTLRGHLSDLGGACGNGGPDAFVRLDIPFRADLFVEAVGVGFTPRVGVVAAGCGKDWARGGLGCTEGVGTWVFDLPVGSAVVVSVGIDPEHPLVQLPPPGEGADPLDFALDLALRRVLGEGEPCQPPGRGRCGTGVACLPAESDGGTAGGDADTSVCTLLDADTCARPQTLSVTTGTTLLQIPASVLHTDAHAHSCTGARRPERVVELQLPTSAAVGYRVQAWTAAANVGLALRGAMCAPAQELDCAPPGAAGAEVAAEVAPSTGPVFLFVELPPTEGGTASGAESSGGEAPGEEAPITVQLAVSELR